MLVVQPLDRPVIGRFSSACLVALTTLFIVTGAANAGTLYLSRLSGAGENPPTTSAATGLGVLILNDAETLATITATHDISLPVTGGHIHRGAANVNGPVIFPFAPPVSPVGPLTWNIPAAEVGNLKNMGLYMNFHTAVNPGGAIRGQLVRALLAPAATSGPQGRVATALDVSAGYTAELNSILVQANLASSATQTLILEELSGRTIYVPARQEIEAMSSMTDSLFARADDVRLGGAPATTSRVTPFILAGGGFGQRPTDRNQAGSTLSRPFLAAGIDCRFDEKSRGGLALGFTDARDTFKANVGQTKTKLTSLQGFVSGELGATGVTLDGRRRGAVTGHVARLAGDFADHASAHVLVLVFQLDFLGDGHAVLRHRRRAEALLEDDVPALGAERHLHRAGEFRDAAAHGLAGFLVERNLLGSHSISLDESGRCLGSESVFRWPSR